MLYLQSNYDICTGIDLYQYVEENGHVSCGFIDPNPSTQSLILTHSLAFHFRLKEVAPLLGSDLDPVGREIGLLFWAVLIQRQGVALYY